MSSGCYRSADDLVRDANRRMQAEEGRQAAWQAAVQFSDEELHRGEGLAYSVELLGDVTATALKAQTGGLAVTSDVLP